MNSYPERRKHDPDEPDPAKRPAHVSPQWNPGDTNEGGCHCQATRGNYKDGIHYMERVFRIKYDMLQIVQRFHSLKKSVVKTKLRVDQLFC